MTSSLDRFTQNKLESLDGLQLRRRLTETRRDDGLVVTRGDRRLISFCCNDYLNLTHHPAVIEAAAAALRNYGAGAGASRLVTGNHPLYAALESRLATYRRTDKAIVFGSGYLANLGTMAALAGSRDLILLDVLAHSCMHAGGRVSGAKVMLFRHNDIGHLAELLQTLRPAHRHCLIVTEKVFSMDGDLAPLDAIATLADDHDAWVLSDDAHGLGVVPVSNAAPLQMGTLSKALGSYGGYLCASAPVVEFLHSRAASFVYTTGLPPASIAAALTALDLIIADPVWAAQPLQRARLFATALGLPEPSSQIVPIILGSATKAMEASVLLESAGFLVTGIRPPTVPAGTARLRITFTAGHTDDHVLGLAEAVRGILT